VGFDSILGMIDRGAVVGAMTNVIVAGLVAAAAVWAIPIVIAGLPAWLPWLPLSGLGAVGASLGLHWLYGGLAGFIGGMTGAMVKAAINRQPIVYTAKNTQDDFLWSAWFLFFGEAVNQAARWAVTTQFRREAANVATTMSQGGIPSNNGEVLQINQLAQNGKPQDMDNALLFPPNKVNITIYHLSVGLDSLLNDNYWNDFADFIANW